MKKLLILLLTICLSFSSVLIIKAEDFDTDKDKYIEMCSKPDSQKTPEEVQTCKSFMSYMASQSTDLNKQLKEIEDKREEIAKDIKIYAEKVRGYDIQIASLKKEIDELNAEIVIKEEEIRVKEEEIAAQQAEIDALKEKLKNRMVTTQKTMRINKYLDILIGSKDFNDLIRRTNGINSILSYDQATLDQMAEMIVQLNIAKDALELAKAELDSKKQEIVNKQNTLLVYRQEAETVRQEYLKKEAELEAEGNKIAGNLEAIKNTMAEIASKLVEIAASSGFMRPLSGGRVTAGTWYYPDSFGGGVHLGMDFAAPSGSTVVAVGNGVILKSVDGCGVGYLGNSCGGNLGGSYGGGNQVYLLTNINGSLYAIKYLHLLAGTPISTGTIVSAGDRVGAVGSSGNSSGSHLHIEVFYLGSGSIASYAQNWNGDLAFGAGWSYAALSRLCENGAGAPCRIKPESVFGG